MDLDRNKSALRVAARFLQAFTVPFTGKGVLNYQQEIDTVITLSKQVQTQDEFDRLGKYCKDLSRRIRDSEEALLPYLQDIAIKGEYKSVEKQIHSWGQSLRFPLSSILSQVGNFPSWDLLHGEDMEPWRAKEILWSWRDKLDKLNQGLPKVAEFLDKLIKRTKSIPQLPDRSEIVMHLSGFDANLIGFDENDPKHIRGLNLLKASLKEYVSKASKVMPDLVKRKVPIIAHFETDSLFGPAGRVGTREINIWPLRLSTIDNTVHTISHEMAHWFDFSIQSSAARAFWSTAIKGDKGTLDLRDLLKKWSKSVPFYTFFSTLKEQDPVYYLQVDAMINGYTNLPKTLLNNFEWEPISEYLEGGGNPMVTVAMTPITAYASYSIDEAFAEAVSMAVTYGARAVHPLVLQWLRTALPGGFKLASMVQQPVRATDWEYPCR